MVLIAVLGRLAPYLLAMQDPVMFSPSAHASEGLFLLVFTRLH
jgi:hypothetical protein